MSFYGLQIKRLTVGPIDVEHVAERVENCRRQKKGKRAWLTLKNNYNYVPRPTLRLVSFFNLCNFFWIVYILKPLLNTGLNPFILLILKDGNSVVFRLLF